jgi:chromosome segregation ATPase
VGEVDLEVQLQVWKDLAISKQVLMGAATDALGLDPDCGADELKVALDKAIKRSIDADVNIKNAQDQAKTAVAVIEKKLEEAQKALDLAEQGKEEAETTLKKGQEQMAASRSANAEELKKIKSQLADKQKSLKAINLALADTPENVIKKLKTLKKQKMDEASERKRVEGELSSLKKEKLGLEKELEEAKSFKEQAAVLVESHRNLHQMAESLRERLDGKMDEGEELPDMPKLDQELLETLSESKETEEN